MRGCGQPGHHVVTHTLHTSVQWTGVCGPGPGMGRLPVRTVTSDVTVSMAAGGQGPDSATGSRGAVPPYSHTPTPTRPWGVHGASVSWLS